ncbi:unnamed protein product, partial [Rotaria magnacalcarata]
MDAIKELSSISEDNFIQLLRNILDEYFHRHSSFKNAINADSQIRLQLEQLLRSTNPSSDK